MASISNFIPCGHLNQPILGVLVFPEMFIGVFIYKESHFLIFRHFLNHFPKFLKMII